MSKNGFTSDHIVDNHGNPAGGVSRKKNAVVYWQNGPVESDEDINGAFVEDIIDIAIDRIDFYQGSQFNCAENDAALKHLNIANKCLNYRTEKRDEAGVEGSHKKHATPEDFAEFLLELEGAPVQVDVSSFEDKIQQLEKECAEFKAESLESVKESDMLKERVKELEKKLSEKMAEIKELKKPTPKGK